MGTFLTGFLTGVAKGANERIEKEREDEEALITSRLKTAYINKTKREEEARAKREEARARRDEVDVLFPAASLEQRLALVASPLIFEQAKKSAGSVDLNKLLVVNKDKIPKNLTSVNEFIDSIQGRPQGATATTEMQSREVFGVDVTPSKGRIESLASQFGGSAADLLAYETVPDSIEVPQFASINLDALKKDKTSKERLEEANAAATQAVLEFGKDSEQAKAAMDNFKFVKGIDDALNPSDAKWATYVSNLKLAMATGTPEQKAAAEAEYIREVKRIEAMSATEKAETLPSLNSFSSWLRKEAAEVLRKKYGSALKDNLIVTEDQTGTTYQWIGTDMERQAQLLKEAREGIRRQAELYLGPDGKALSRDIQAGLMGMGFEFDSEGRMIGSGGTAAAPAAGGSAAPSTGGAAATQPKPTAPPKPEIPDMSDFDSKVTADMSAGRIAFLKNNPNEAYRQWSKTPNAPESLYGIGRILYEGLGGEADKVKGLQMIQQAAEAGSAEAKAYISRKGPMKVAAPAASIPAPKTQQEYDALPSGTEYIDTDGTKKRKK